MFQDVVQLTQFTLIKTLEDTPITLNTKALYDAYRKMDNAIFRMHVLESHYLSLPFDTDFLQNSNHGMPFQKWCCVIEEDFDMLRKEMRAFLAALVYVRYQKINEDFEKSISIIEKFVSIKHIFGFFSYHYESGKLSKDGQSILFAKLIIGEKYFYEESTIRIDSHEKRVALCQEIKDSIEEMKKLLYFVKSFILTNVSLEELL